MPPTVVAEAAPGADQIVLGEALNVVIAQGYEKVGEVVMLKELLADSERALVISQADEERVVRLAEPIAENTANLARPGGGFTTATDCPGLICSLPLRSMLSACNCHRDGRNAPRRERLRHRIVSRPAIRLGWPWS